MKVAIDFNQTNWLTERSDQKTIVIQLNKQLVRKLKKPQRFATDNIAFFNDVISFRNENGFIFFKVNSYTEERVWFIQDGLHYKIGGYLNHPEIPMNWFEKICEGHP